MLHLTFRHTGIHELQAYIANNLSHTQTVHNCRIGYPNVCGIASVPGTPSDPCGCPAGFSRCAGRCLALLPQKVNFAEAEVLCAAQTAHLAVPRSEAENNCVLALADGKDFWLGVNDREMEGQWVAADGECGEVPASTAWWLQDEPTGLENDNCILIHLGAWADTACDSPNLLFPPMCQLSSCLQPQCP